MDIYERLQAAMAEVTNDESLELGLTNNGKKKFGNQTLRLTYKQNHLVAKAMHRHDLQQFPESRAAYIKELHASEEYPWLSLPAVGKYSLLNIPGAIRLEPSKHLNASVLSGLAIYTALNDVPREAAYLRQWQAGNGGVGVELLILTADEVFEISINYYAKPQTEIIADLLVKTA